MNGKRIVLRVTEAAPLPASRYDQSDVMLDPWMEFPAEGGTVVEAMIGAATLPDLSDMPQDES